MKEDIKMTSGLQSTEGGEGLEREQACVVWCLGSTGSFRFLSLLSGKEAEEVGYASSTVDLHLHLVVCLGCLSAYKYAYC